MGLALALVIVIYGYVIFTDKRASRLDEAIRVKAVDSGSSQINPEVVDE